MMADNCWQILLVSNYQFFLVLLYFRNLYFYAVNAEVMTLGKYITLNDICMQKFVLILFVGMLGVFIGSQTMETLTVVDDVVLENVEALANSEMPGITTCRGDGDVVCPANKRKCAVVDIGYSLR